MELMATPRASAISPISGAAVPEEGEISTRVRARAVPTHSCDATCGMHPGSGMQRGPDVARILAERSFPESAEGKSGLR